MSAHNILSKVAERAEDRETLKNAFIELGKELIKRGIPLPKIGKSKSKKGSKPKKKKKDSFNDIFDIEDRNAAAVFDETNAYVHDE